jgi:hypothetical protein
MYMGAYNTLADRGDLGKFRSKVPVIAGRTTTMASFKKLPSRD